MNNEQSDHPPHGTSTNLSLLPCPQLRTEQPVPVSQLVSFFSQPFPPDLRINSSLIGLFPTLSGFYGIFLAHLAGVDSATMLDTFASLPGWMQLSTKALIAGPAAYHTINGFRHLGWDTGYRTLIPLSARDEYSVKLTFHNSKLFLFFVPRPLFRNSSQPQDLLHGWLRCYRSYSCHHRWAPRSLIAFPLSSPPLSFPFASLPRDVQPLAVITHTSRTFLPLTFAAHFMTERRRDV